jgi:hypothetical protein
MKSINCKPFLKCKNRAKNASAFEDMILCNMLQKKPNVGVSVVYEKPACERAKELSEKFHNHCYDKRTENI